MMLQFDKQLNGELTYFPEKITKSLIENEIFPDDDVLNFICSKYSIFNATEFINCLPKNFTIRRDQEDFWNEDQIIEFSFDGKTLMLPSVPVISVQEILMTYIQGRFEISIDDKYISGWNSLMALAINDGFDSFTDFSIYYKNKMENGVFTGKIIHWTHLRY
jgi:hypothetical protein